MYDGRAVRHLRVRMSAFGRPSKQASYMFPDHLPAWYIPAHVSGIIQGKIMALNSD